MSCRNPPIVCWQRCDDSHVARGSPFSCLTLSLFKQSCQHPPQNHDIACQYEKVDKKELNAWHKGFIKDCPQGYIERNEFLKIYKQFFPFGDSATFADCIFKVFDKHQRGRIEFREFIIGLSIASRGNVTEKLDCVFLCSVCWLQNAVSLIQSTSKTVAFQLYDSDNDGFVRKDDIRRIIDAVYKMVGSVMTAPIDIDPSLETPEGRCDRIWELMDPVCFYTDWACVSGFVVLSKLANRNVFHLNSKERALSANRISLLAVNEIN